MEEPCLPRYCVLRLDNSVFRYSPRLIGYDWPPGWWRLLTDDEEGRKADRDVAPVAIDMLFL